MQLFYLVHVLYGTLIKSLGVFSATNIRKYLEKAKNNGIIFNDYPQLSVKRVQKCMSSSFTPRTGIQCRELLM